MQRKTHLINISTSSLLAVLILISYKCSTPSVIVTREQQSGDSYFNSHNYPEAIAHYKNMLNASKQLGVYRNITAEAAAHRKIADSYIMMGRYNEATVSARTALRNDSTENNTVSIIQDYRLMGKIEMYKGLNREAIRHFEKAVLLGEDIDESFKNINRNAIAENHLVLGQLYTAMGSFNLASENITNAMDLYVSTGNSRGEMESLLALGSIYTDLGDLEFAGSILEKSKSIAEENEFSTSRHFNKLAQISLARGEFEDAIKKQEEALRQADEYNIIAQEIWYTIRLGDIYRDLGDQDRSMRYYKKARSDRDSIMSETSSLEASVNLRLGDLAAAHDYFTKQRSNIGAGITLFRMAELELLKSNLTEALSHLNDAGDLFYESGNRIGIANVQLHKGIIYSKQEKLLTAKSFLDSAKMDDSYPEIKWQAAYQKGIIFEKQSEPEKAVGEYLDAIEVIENIRGNITIEEFRNTYINNKINVYNRLINLYLELDRPIPALETTEKAKARTFFEMLAEKKINFESDKKDSLIRKEQELRFRIQKLYRQLQSITNNPGVKPETRRAARNELASELKIHQEEYNDILLRMKLYNPDYSEIINTGSVNIEDIKLSLDKNTAILSYWISNDKIYAWCITHNNIFQTSVSVEANILIKTIENARTHIASNATTKAENELEILYGYLIEPLKAGILNKPELIIIPNKSLHFLPFQALRDRNGRYLMENYNISYEPSLSVYKLIQSKKLPAGRKFFGGALADVAIGLNTGLPATRTEIEKIMPLFDYNTSSIGKNCTETFIKDNISGFNYIHLATHGFFNFEQPVYSFLLFPGSENDDGRLTVHEVFSMKLNARLVTLSACETGLGYLDRGDEIIGLSRSFMYAGSRAVIVSLWCVADYQTSLLMTKFYNHIKDHSPREALAMAQREVKEDYPNPFFWAPFILLGE